MEIGPISNLSGDCFEVLSHKVAKLYSQIDTRKMMTANEKYTLEVMLDQLKLFHDIPKEKKESVQRKIRYLLKTYYVLFD